MTYQEDYLITQFAPKQKTIISVEQSESPFSNLDFSNEYPYFEKGKRKFRYRMMNGSLSNQNEDEIIIIDKDPYDYKIVEEDEDISAEWEFVEEIKFYRESWERNNRDLANKLYELQKEYEALLNLHINEVEGEEDMTKLWLTIKRIKEERSRLQEKARKLPSLYFSHMEQVHQFIRQYVLPIIPAKVNGYELSLVPSMGAERKIYNEPSCFLKKNETGVLIELSKTQYEPYALFLTFTNRKED